jgi:hypothetical protein
MAVTGDTIDQHDCDIPIAVSQAVVRAARNLPWECKCLVQAMAGKAMLRLRGVSSTLYLGLAKGENEQLCAHAWLRCGNIILTGGRVNGQFTVVSFFGDEISVSS